MFIVMTASIIVTAVFFTALRIDNFSEFATGSETGSDWKIIQDAPGDRNVDVRLY